MYARWLIFYSPLGLVLLAYTTVLGRTLFAFVLDVQTQLNALKSGLRAVGDPELGYDVPHVLFCCTQADRQVLGDLTIRLPLNN